MKTASTPHKVTITVVVANLLAKFKVSHSCFMTFVSRTFFFFAFSWFNLVKLEAKRCLQVRGTHECISDIWTPGPPSEADARCMFMHLPHFKLQLQSCRLVLLTAAISRFNWLYIHKPKAPCASSDIKCCLDVENFVVELWRRLNLSVTFEEKPVKQSIESIE